MQSKFVIHIDSNRMIVLDIRLVSIGKKPIHSVNYHDYNLYLMRFFFLDKWMSREKNSEIFEIEFFFVLFSSEFTEQNFEQLEQQGWKNLPNQKKNNNIQLAISSLFIFLFMDDIW